MKKLFDELDTFAISNEHNRRMCILTASKKTHPMFLPKWI